MSLPDPVSESTGNVKIIIIVLSIAALIGLLGWLFWSRASLQAQVSQQKTEISDYQSANKQCKKDIDASNARVDEIAAASNARALVADKALKAAQSIASRYTTKAAAVIAMKPQDSDDCKATKKLLDDYFSGTIK